MTTPSQPIELDKAIEQCCEWFYPDALPERFDTVLTAAKRTQQLEQEVKDWKAGFDAEAHRGDELFKRVEDLESIAEKMYEALKAEQRLYMHTIRCRPCLEALLNGHNLCDKHRKLCVDSVTSHQVYQALALAQASGIGKDKK